MSTRIHVLWRAGSVLALAALAVLLSGGCVTVREELQPVRETVLTVARSGEDVTLSWIGTAGAYYTVTYATSHRGPHVPLPDAINIRAVATGEPIIVKDRVRPSEQRYYRLVQGRLPMTR